MVDREAQPDLTDEETLRAREEKRAGLAARKAKRTPKRGLVIVYTGDGKGKTTAALGVLFRAWGREMRVVMFQFIKAKTGKWGEVQAFGKMGIEITPLGGGFTWLSENIEQDKAHAREGWTIIRARILSTDDPAIYSCKPIIFSNLQIRCSLCSRKCSPTCPARIKAEYKSACFPRPTNLRTHLRTH